MSSRAGWPAQSVVLAKPRSFMNESGGPVAAVARFYKIAPEQIIVVQDELDLPFGALRLKRGGSEGGHNGVRSVVAVARLARVRPGAGRGRPAAAVAKTRPTTCCATSARSSATSCRC